MPEAHKLHDKIIRSYLFTLNKGGPTESNLNAAEVDLILLALSRARGISRTAVKERGMKIVGGKLMSVCTNCGQIIRIDKPLFGSLHICTTPDERHMYATEINRRFASMKAALDKA